ncbi:MAG: glycosyltransferase [Tetrasphaera sp.]
MRPRIGVSGPVRPDSGIGVIQRELHARLAADCELVPSASRDAAHGPLAAVRGLAAGLQPPARGLDGYVGMVSPLPLRVPAPLVYIVHDLRWLRSGAAKRTYRALDLRRAVRSAERLVCVSECTRRDLVAHYPEAAATAQAAWLGPGVVTSADWGDGIPGRVLLVGGDPRKQNERAADVLAALPAGLITSVVGVGVSARCAELAGAAVGADNVQVRHRLPDEQMAAEFTQAQFYVHLGTDEGFGLPYVEALASGCVPVAIDQPLTREVLGDAGILLRDAPVPDLAAQWAGAASPSAAARRERATRFSWDAFAAVVREGLQLPPAA